MVEIPTLTLSFLTDHRLGQFRLVHVDYRAWWLGTRLPYWILYIWMVYALLQAVMHEYPGVHRLSSRVLNGSIAFSAVVAGVTIARLVYLLPSREDFWTWSFAIATSLERTVSVASLILLLGVLGFLVWFPVAVPRNLVVFSVTYIVFFAANVVAFSLYNGNNVRVIAWIGWIVATLCYWCWLLFLSEAGERAASRIGHSWNPSDRERLLGQLGAINATLLEAARAQR